MYQDQNLLNYGTELPHHHHSAIGLVCPRTKFDKENLVKLYIGHVSLHFSERKYKLQGSRNIMVAL